MPPTSAHTCVNTKALAVIVLLLVVADPTKSPRITLSLGSIAALLALAVAAAGGAVVQCDGL